MVRFPAARYPADTAGAECLLAASSPGWALGSLQRVRKQALHGVEVLVSLREREYSEVYKAHAVAANIVVRRSCWTVTDAPLPGVQR